MLPEFYMYAVNGLVGYTAWYRLVMNNALCCSNSRTRTQQCLVTQDSSVRCHHLVVGLYFRKAYLYVYKCLHLLSTACTEARAGACIYMNGSVFSYKPTVRSMYCVTGVAAVRSLAPIRTSSSLNAVVEDVCYVNTEIMLVHFDYIHCRFAKKDALVSRLIIANSRHRSSECS